MIIGKRASRRAALFSFCCFAIFLFLCAILTACSSDGHPFVSVSVLQEATSTTTSELPVYRIRYSQQASETLIHAAQRLSEAIEIQTGCTVYVMSDGQEDWDRDGRVSDILLGLTDHPLSQFYLSSKNRDDYLCHMENGILILGGPDDAATVAAVERFLIECLPYANGTELIEEGTAFSYSASYPCRKLLFNSYNIKRYTIVYPKENGMHAYESAQRLRNRIADLCGAWLPVCTDDRADLSKPVIAVGMCLSQGAPSQSGMAYWSAEQQRICLVASDSYGLSCAADAFCRLLEQNSHPNSAAVEVTGTFYVPYERPTLDLLNVSSVWKDGYTVTDCIAVAELVYRSDADLCILGIMDPFIWDALRFNIASDWSAQTVSLPNGTVVPILFRKDSMTLSSLPLAHRKETLAWIEASFVLGTERTELTVLYLPSQEADNTLTERVIGGYLAQSKTCVVVTEDGNGSALWAESLMVNRIESTDLLFSAPHTLAVCTVPQAWEICMLPSETYRAGAVEWIGRSVRLALVSMETGH
ncbi:MAG: hypothetical protein IJY42_01345 [Clostridia bacterium]|nr:hypothetical protein [Clostridia bacterium]